MTKKLADGGGAGRHSLRRRPRALWRRSRARRRSPKKVQNIPIELQVVISRYQGEKRISSLPYVLSLKSYVNSLRGGGTGASLRLGSRVPIRQQTFVPAADGKPATTTGSVNYENVGTNIDAGASALEDGRYEVTVQHQRIVGGDRPARSQGNARERQLSGIPVVSVHEHAVRQGRADGAVHRGE